MREGGDDETENNWREETGSRHENDEEEEADMRDLEKGVVYGVMKRRVIDWKWKDCEFRWNSRKSRKRKEYLKTWNIEFF